ncbi:Golgi phosphoprotein 3 (GPP34) [Jatrophihabitans endophyticus]|uniref:Golgi phosphoprotein 3 (GPP34) n=1 Tax=Jatrophihabitans endophyticus TaxID=1206085 RepID=A0A1M5DTS3_9ACTN|nr:CPBP family glutamic-type intramembrane protease [Jatrophihabitans endophyticus]SHF70393.1 Golgi phosphoprotein 3 (GPP34) [Jatrophihabitans endophyticus]
MRDAPGAAYGERVVTFEWIEPRFGAMAIVLLSLRFLVVLVGWTPFYQLGLALAGHRDAASRRPVTAPAVGIGQVVTLGLVLGAVAADSRLRASAIGIRTPSHTGLVATVALVAAFPLGIGLGRLLLRTRSTAVGSTAPRPQASQPSRASSARVAWAQTQPLTWSLVVIAVVLVPLQQELLFRGLLLGVLVGPAGLAPVLGVVLVSAVYALAAVRHGPRSVTFVAALGLFTAGLYLSTGSLVLPVLVQAMLQATVLVSRWARYGTAPVPAPGAPRPAAPYPVAAGHGAGIALPPGQAVPYLAAPATTRWGGGGSYPNRPAVEFTWTNSVCSDLLRAVLHRGRGRIGNHAAVARAARAALIVDLLRTDVVHGTADAFVPGSAWTRMPAARRLVEALISRPTPPLEVLLQRGQPTLHLVLDDLVAAGVLRRVTRFGRTRYTDVDPGHAERLVAAVARAAQGGREQMDSAGAAFVVLALECGIARTDPNTDRIGELISRGGDFAPLLTRMRATLESQARTAWVAGQAQSC